jgi:hypothetical protein
MAADIYRRPARTSSQAQLPLGNGVVILAGRAAFAGGQAQFPRILPAPGGTVAPSAAEPASEPSKCDVVGGGGAGITGGIDSPPDMGVAAPGWANAGAVTNSARENIEPPNTALLFIAVPSHKRQLFQIVRRTGIRTYR